MEKEKSNNLYTKSYFIKRLVEKKFYVQNVIDSYPKFDSRYWTILVNPGRNNFLITCIRNKDKPTAQFRINAKNDTNIIIETESMEVIISTLMNLVKDQKVSPVVF